ncbi:G-protein coupled receptor GRL101-like [Stylophora pistillata]|uniref:G-protein coupled receptor GRL101-like n=1 Tax=Stylophora pistillata TaxID=50429 RepID=UPI000C05093D|nr:G-protein coupled receptor GRL101-like [Stylophora pistillata]
MHYNLMAELPKGLFTQQLKHIIRVTLDTNLMCCHLDLFRQDADCDYSFNDNFASCQSIFRNLAPRRCLWVVGLLSLFGSVFVVGWQYFFPDNNVVQSIMLVNLGISDGIMGIYLIIIAIKDLQWSGEYYLHDYEWRTGWFCHFNGAMSILSSEVSVMMISLIAWDRLKNIVFPYTFAKITPRQARLVCAVIWLVGGVMAFLPLSGMRYFGDWYYGKNVVCLPLQLSPQLQDGWEYSTSIFIVLNFSLFIFVMVAYIAILLRSWSSSRRLGAHGNVREIQVRAQSAQAKRERALAKRVFFIILTDFLCWIPLIAIGIKSHVEKTFDPPGDLAVWIAVFALPINSAINPLLDTLSTQQVQAILKPKLRKLWSNVQSIFCRGQNQEDEAENVQQRQIGNEDAHAINEEGEHIEMQVIDQHDIPGVEAPELPAPQSDYEDAFDIRPATKKTVKVTVHHGESQYRRKRRNGVQEEESKPRLKEPTKAGEPEYQMESEEFPVSSDQGKEGESKPERKKPTEEAAEFEEQIASEEIPVPSDKEESAFEPDMDLAEEGNFPSKLANRYDV